MLSGKKIDKLSSAVHVWLNGKVPTKITNLYNYTHLQIPMYKLYNNHYSNYIKMLDFCDVKPEIKTNQIRPLSSFNTLIQSIKFKNYFP